MLSSSTAAFEELAVRAADSWLRDLDPFLELLEGLFSLTFCLIDLRHVFGSR